MIKIILEKLQSTEAYIIITLGMYALISYEKSFDSMSTAAESIETAKSLLFTSLTLATFSKISFFLNKARTNRNRNNENLNENSSIHQWASWYEFSMIFFGKLFLLAGINVYLLGGFCSRFEGNRIMNCKLASVCFMTIFSYNMLRQF